MNAASDLYGVGIRTGAYLQILGMLLSCAREQNRSRIGIKLLSSALCLTILLSWTVLVSHQSLSPCEAWLVLSLANAYATPRSAAMKHADSKSHRGGVALFFALLSTVWQTVSLMWFFATLVLQLPTLETKNLVWFFTAVDVAGWFRIVMLCYSTIYCLFLPLEIIEYLGLLRRTFVDWAGVKNAAMERSCKWAPLMRDIARVVRWLEDNRVFKQVYALTDMFFEWFLGITEGMETDEVEEILRKFQRNCRRFWVLLGVVTLVLTIAGIEKTIDYNNLSPQNDLSQPGQAIPFILGIITVMEGLASAWKPEESGLPPVADSDSGTDEVPSRGEPVNTPASSSSWWKVWLPGKEGDVTSSSRKEKTEATSV